LHVNALLDRNVALLTASRRLAHALKIGYARYAQDQGRLAWRTPRVLPWGAWLSEQWRERRASGASVSARLLTPAQARVLWRRVVLESEEGERLLNPARAARTAQASWRALHDYVIPLERLRGFDQPEAQALHAWCSAYSRRCADLGAIDEAQLAAWAFDQRIEPEQPIAFAGFDVVPPALARLAEFWRANGKFVDVQPSDETCSDVQVVAARDAAAEIELAARWARAFYV
jgi:hypothetical protein